MSAGFEANTFKSVLRHLFSILSVLFSLCNIFTVESSTTILFNEYILKILDAIWLQDYVKFYVEIDKLNELKAQYPNYRYTDSLNIMVQLEISLILFYLRIKIK